MYPFSIFGQVCSKPIRDFYGVCDGGPVNRLNSEFLSLKVALQVWDCPGEVTEWRYFPVFWDGEHHSDPVVVGIDGPLHGYVFQERHDGYWRVLSPSLSSFVRALSKIKDNNRFFVEDHQFDYPRRLEGNDACVFTGLLELSYRSQSRWFSKGRFTELALSMADDDSLLNLLPSRPHPDNNSRHMIERRLRGLGTRASRLIRTICGGKK